MAPGRLFVVSTPIGDPSDLSPRARQVLSSVQVIAAEDTRVTRSLLQELGLTCPRLVSVHDHNERDRAPMLLEALLAGSDVAVVSDAGTPLLSDPGFRIVRAAIDADVHLVPVPGPSALLAGLVAAGLPTDRFTFVGFLPRQPGRRDAEIANLRRRSETLVFYEAPHRVLDTLDALVRGLGDRPACLAVSVTKVWERYHRGSIAEVRSAIADEGEIRGEMTLVIGGCTEPRHAADQDLAGELVTRMVEAGLSAAAIRDVVAGALGVPRRDVYQAALSAQRERAARLETDRG